MYSSFSLSLIILSTVVFLFNSKTKSTTEPVDTGTLIAAPCNLPFKLGITLPIALAAPVDAGTILLAALLPLLALIPFG